MKTFTIVPRGKKYWVEEIDEDGSRRAIIGFGTEAAALQCVADLKVGFRTWGAPDGH
jgi:hypothetical protein